jgi:5-methylcytosine-specific restriction enzyme A
MLTQQQFVEILLDKEITKTEDLVLFQTLYSFENHKAYASQIATMLGKSGKNAHGFLNLQVGRLAKRAAKKHEITFYIRSNQKKSYWRVFFNGWSESTYWVWQLKNELREALIETQLTGEVLNTEELPTEYLEKLIEGAKKTIIVNAYERHPQAKKKCVQHHGVSCCICDFNFENTYGILGKDFIHVHHLKPISTIGKSYEIDPIIDLRPVCPNCHAMLHQKKEVLSIEELKMMLKKKQNT